MRFSLIFCAALGVAPAGSAAWAGTQREFSITGGERPLPVVDAAALPSDPSFLNSLIETGGYDLVEIPSDAVERYMPIGRHVENGIPHEIEGIWWISVNPFGGEILTSLGGPASRWDAATRTVYQDNFGPGAYTYESGESGGRAFLNVLLSRMVFAMQFSQDYRYADLRLSIEVLGQRLPVPDAILKYTMDLAEDGRFVRHSWFFGQRVEDYQLRRIVRADGSRDPAYAEYLRAAPPVSVIAVKKSR